jgi:hypothetical protein
VKLSIPQQLHHRRSSANLTWHDQRLDFLIGRGTGTSTAVGAFDKAQAKAPILVAKPSCQVRPPSYRIRTANDLPIGKTVYVSIWFKRTLAGKFPVQPTIAVDSFQVRSFAKPARTLAIARGDIVDSNDLK